ncbi:type I polyketide synthase, partial [Tahibacter caeni]|uniref:type I polyketide synthase n=1 Tax=Tahibacter caeni TaxID=1453545 RepID=UPI00214943CD
APVPAPAEARAVQRSRLPSRSADHAAPAANEPIAIIGVSGRYPESPDLAAFWTNLRDGRDCIVEVPAGRWDWRDYYSADRTESGRHYSRWGGFIDGVDEFDPQFFSIAPREAKFIDPQERLFLQHAWMAVEDAGHCRASLRGNGAADDVGVYVGVMYSEYQLLGVAADAQSLRMGFSGNVASIANRVSYALDLHGPSMTVDTMCSSSLTAIHLACQDLRQGRTRLAIAGGVNISIHPQKYLLLSVGQFISGDGHCQSFGEGGDGYIPGEGVGAVVLKRLSDAQRDGDPIYAVIRGSGLSHGGRTNGYTVPNPQAQTSAIALALSEARVDARHISYIEAHGTGTKLGDPIEIAALNRAFGQYTAERQFCRIGSAKSNIGHCEAAAGIAGLTKVLLQLKHRQIVPSLHSRTLNPHIDFAASPFVVNQELVDWTAPVVDGRTLPRIAGISSFGAGGSNAHLIVEEYVAPAAAAATSEPALVVLSARTPEQLRRKAADLRDFLVRAPATALDALAYTLQAGREAFDERIAIVVDTAADLIGKLDRFAAGDGEVDALYQGHAKRHKEALSLFSTDSDLQQTLGRWLAGRKLDQLAELWTRGLDWDWNALYASGARPARLNLPTYPFARERHWLELPAAGTVAPAAAPHPLLHANTSDLYRQSFASSFRGDEPFCTDRRLQAGACLEMARAALQLAARVDTSTALELSRVDWQDAPPLDGDTPVTVSLQAIDDACFAFEIAGGERVFCAGEAVLLDGAPPPPLSLAALQAGPEA